MFSYAILLSYKVGCNFENYSLRIDENMSVQAISNILEDKMCIDPFVFKLGLKLTFNDKNIKYGRYNLKGVSTLRSLIEMITTVSKDRIKVTLIDGWKMQDIALELESTMGIDVETFIEECYNKDLIKNLEIDNNVDNLEGFLYPDTYIFLKSYTERDIIKILVNEFMNNYNNFVKTKTHLSLYEIVTLASIIQAESKFKNDMDTISSVYHNRLNKNMLLQADPTVQYLFPKQKKRVLYKDTEIDNPYNTYIYKGLPPGPINNPSIDAIVAAAKPPKTNYYYFVANGKGTHTFNTTYNNHLKSKKNASR